MSSADVGAFFPPQTLKENVDELDLGTQYHLSRYAYLLENVLVTEGLTIAPVAPEDGESSGFFRF